MGCGISKGAAKPKDPPLPDFPLRDEAVRIFKLADKDANGKLDLAEIKEVVKRPEMAEAALEK